MINILLVETNERVIEILKENLTREFAATIQIASNAENALSAIIKATLPYHLIIVRNQLKNSNNLDEEETAKIIINGLYDKHYPIPVITLGSVEISGANFKSLPDRFRLDDLYKMVKESLQLKKDDLLDIKLPPYIPVPVNYFFLMNKCCCDVYIRIKRDDLEQYIKRILANDEFDKAAIQRYHTEHNLKEFFIKKEDRHYFFDSLISQTLQKLESSKESIAQTVEVIGDSFDMNQGALQDMGINESTIMMVNATTSAMMATIESNSTDLGPLLRALLSDTTSYNYKHSQLIALFAHKILENLEWSNSSTGQGHATLEKIVFISFFHDILLKDERLAKVNDLEAFHREEHSFNGDEKDLILTHANKVATLVQEYPKTPIGADVILRQHHGTANGVGFPEKYTLSTISPMAIMFLVIEYFVDELLAHCQEKNGIRSIIDRLNIRFAHPSYKKVVDALKSSFSKD